MTHSKHAETGQPDGQHHNTHLVYHLQHLISTTPLNTTRPEPKHTHQQLALAELLASARKTIAHLARTQHPYPTHIPNRFYRHFQRYFDPPRAFESLLQLGSRGVGWSRRMAVACVAGAAGGSVVAAVGGGVSLDEKRVWIGSEAVLGVGQRGAERGVECVGVWGVAVERVSGVGVDGGSALGWVSGSCAVDISGCIVECAVWVVGWGHKGRVLGDWVGVAEVPKNGAMGWCWAVRVLLSWLCAFRL